MSWHVEEFTTEDGHRSVHVYPDRGEHLLDHDGLCLCEPKVERKPDSDPLVIHNEVH